MTSASQFAVTHVLWLNARQNMEELNLLTPFCEEVEERRFDGFRTLKQSFQIWNSLRTLCRLNWQSQMRHLDGGIMGA